MLSASLAEALQQRLSGTWLRLAVWVSLPSLPTPQPSRPRLDSKEFPPPAAGLSAQAGFIHKRDADLGARSGGQAFLPRSPSWPPPTSLGLPSGASSRGQRHPGTGPAIPEKVAPQDHPARNERLPTFLWQPSRTAPAPHLQRLTWGHRDRTQEGATSISLVQPAFQQPNGQQLLSQALALHQALGRLANPHTYFMTQAPGIAPFCRWRD